ncbi:receptor-type tyrosine-protein phosphatase mu-like [Lineus longissimus]|uniref:receptor-type tyrosine-protein phosphatase mu-like n=1 Tax=Lineus longissimus TaxID=88925 RepID=UPI002B4D8692
MAERSDGGRSLLTTRLLLISLSCFGFYCSAAVEGDHPCSQDGFFGRSCHFKCNCKRAASCDKTTGICPSGECAGDSWGDHCLLSSSCSYNDEKICVVGGVAGTCTGLAYLGKMSQSVNGNCHPWKYHGNYPDSDFRHLDGTRSDAKKYCRNPKTDDANKPWCYTTSGGWKYCSVGDCACPRYRFGENCDSECLCYDVDEVCDSRSGVCPRSGHCWKGVTGTHCKTSCQDGKFGINCEYTCRCRAGAVCHKTTGKCPNECDYGWSGEACQIGNGALGKTAEQSSTYVQMSPTYKSFDASRAVDNNTDPDLSNGHCSHTKTMDKPWWRVDLSYPHVLFSLTIFNRDCSQCGGPNTPETRLKEIKIWMTDRRITYPTDDDLCYFLAGSIPDAGSQMIQCTKPVIGRYLFIQLQYDNAILDFCEVKIHAYQYKACPYLEHGPNCNLKCQCQDVTEKCDIITGRCSMSGCNDQYTGENCQIELPSMKRPPTRLNYTRNSITVAWPVWQQEMDNGKGPVTKYKLQYAESGTSSWTDAGIFSNNFDFTVTGLDSFTFYDFRIILGWQGDSATSVLFGPEPGVGAVGTSRTSCIEPSLGPNITSHRGSIEDMSVWPSKITVELKWDAIPLVSLNCRSLKAYIVYYYNEGSTEWLQDSTKDTNIKLTGLAANMGYKIVVGVVNAEGYQTNGTVKGIKTLEGRPGNVSSLHVEKLPNSELKVTWQKPQQSYGTIKGYHIQWQQVAYGMCKNVTGAGTILHLSESTFSHKVEWIDVCPYCRYRIKVFAETSGGNGTEVEVQEFTSPGVPMRKPHVVTGRLTSRSISIKWWEYPCEDRNGPNGSYSIQLNNLDSNNVRTLDPIPLGNVYQKVVTGLIPYTRYSLVFMFVNSEGASPNETFEFRTREEVPPPPRLEKLAISPDSITVAWYPPDPPFGKILEFQLRYWEQTDYNETKNLLTISNGVEGRKIFDDLTTDVTYVFMIQAKTSIGWGNWSKKLVLLTEEDWPGIPEYLKMSEKSTESFKLTWAAPSRPSVVLIGCKITCKPVSSYNKNITANALKHRKEYILSEWITTQHVLGLNQATQYNCSIQARGNKGYGKAASNLFWTRPKLEMTDEKFVQIKTHQMTDHTITINIPPAETFAAPISSFFVGVEDKTNQRQKRIATIDSSTTDNLTDYTTAKQRGLHQYIAAELDKGYNGPFIIGDGKTYGKYTNPKLETGHKYNVIFGVVSDLDGEKVMKFAKTSDQVTVIQYKSPSGSPVVYIVVAVVLIILLIFVALGAAFFIRRRRLKYMCKSESLTDVKKMGPEEMKVINGVANPALIAVPPATEATASCEDLIAQTRLDASDGDLYENVPARRSQPKSHAILLDDILSFVAAMKKENCSGFKAEYLQFKPELEHPHDESKKEENKGKNRFKNIVPYDHSRLILDVGESNSSTDYINANYIDGYKKKKAYIASQGPTKAAINDIWRAVWQERCPKIVMLTNFVEMGKAKCERYWPESGSKLYGEITVEVVTEEKFADMTVTALKISKGGQERRLKHFYFTVWPDHGAPKFASSMLHFWREVTGYSGEQYGPVYVHCSAGVGRTGTFIGLDYLIQQGSVEKMVNVYECVRQMRLSRPKMVQTWEQYVFLHDALAEHFRVGLTAFPSSMFCDRYGSMVIPKKKGAKSRLQQQFKLLTLFTSEVQMKNCAGGLAQQNIHKNRSKDIIPEDRCRPYLTLPVEGGTSYINAVFIDGYSKRDTFIVSEMPQAHTVIDLWRLVYDHRVTSIVMLNSLESSDHDSIYWPTSKHKLDNDAFSVESLKEDTSDPDITTRDFKFGRKSKLQMSDQKLERLVRQFQFNAWPEDKVVPSSAKSIVSLVDAVERWQQQSGDGKILVHCMDGGSKSGVFCVAYSVIEKNKVEHDIDVFQYTRLTRMNRPQLISSYEQYKFIHDIVAEYLKQFDIYANFQ